MKINCKISIVRNSLQSSTPPPLHNDSVDYLHCRVLSDVQIFKRLISNFRHSTTVFFIIIYLLFSEGFQMNVFITTRTHNIILLITRIERVRTFHNDMWLDGCCFLHAHRTLLKKTPFCRRKGAKSPARFNKTAIRRSVRVRNANEYLFNEWPDNNPYINVVGFYLSGFFRRLFVPLRLFGWN